MMLCNDWSGTTQKTSPTPHGPNDTNEWERSLTAFTSTANLTGIRWISSNSRSQEVENSRIQEAVVGRDFFTPLLLDFLTPRLLCFFYASSSARTKRRTLATRDRSTGRNRPE